MARSPKSSKGSTKQPDAEDSKAEESAEFKSEDVASVDVQNESVGTVSVPQDDYVDVPGGHKDTTDSQDLGTPQDSDEFVPGVIPAYVRQPAPPPAPLPAASGIGAFGLILGGLIAGAIGFLVATFAVPEGWPNRVSSSDNGVERALSEQSRRLDALAADLAQLQQAPEALAESVVPPDLGPITERLDAAEGSLSDALTELDSRIAEIDQRIGAIESRPEVASPDGSGAMEAQLETFRQQLDEVTSDAEGRIAEAQARASQIEAAAVEATNAAERQAALASIKAAIQNGTAFEEPLSAFDDPPSELASVAESGVATLSDLQASFPEAARIALATSQSVPENASTTERLSAFLLRQTNARSLSPQEGDDVDAKLSRAEAQLKSGDLQATLAELADLPQTAQDSMSEWIAAAESRAAAEASIDALETATK